MVDCAKTEHQAIRSAFPHASVYLCLFVIATEGTVVEAGVWGIGRNGSCLLYRRVGVFIRVVYMEGGAVMKWGEVTMEHCCRGSDNEGVINSDMVDIQCGELIINSRQYCHTLLPMNFASLSLR